MHIKIKTDAAIKHFGGRGKGGVQRLAAALDITHGAVSQWGQYVPEGQAYKLFVLTDGSIEAQRVESPTAA